MAADDLQTLDLTVPRAATATSVAAADKRWQQATDGEAERQEQTAAASLRALLQRIFASFFKSFRSTPHPACSLPSLPPERDRAGGSEGGRARARAGERRHYLTMFGLLTGECARAPCCTIRPCQPTSTATNLSPTPRAPISNPTRVLRTSSCITCPNGSHR